ncbi:tumor necrosis factor receptor superfamily member 16-like [Argopecten irradians]|uniref:tumor necrosis factor receptor superfamily member 16-like n=1 Tax=Argopecten irradians TaxID=31199 RepID=UPI0037135494
MELVNMKSVLLVGMIIPTVMSLNCSTDEFESNATDLCCRKCDPGFGLVNQCTRDNATECSPCVLGETFSLPSAHAQKCVPCTSCQMNEHVVTECNRTHDTVCECNIDFYYNLSKKSCQICDSCAKGFGALRPCTGTHNSVCMRCGNRTFSDKTSAISICKPCSKCVGKQVETEACTPEQDTTCTDVIFDQYTTKPQSNRRGDEYPTETEEESFDVIPVYCTILASVIVGLLFYVMYKHYSRIRDKKRHKGHDLHDDVEYSKTSGADSGVFEDTDHHGYRPCKEIGHHCKYNQLTRIRDLPQSKKKEIEKHLSVKRAGAERLVEDWTVLARELGYTNKKIDKIANKNKDTLSTVQYLLSDWSKSRTATVGVFIKALIDIGRPDVVKLLQNDGKSETLVQMV